MGISGSEGHEADRELDRQAFGRLLRSARGACKLSQATLAKAVEVSPVFISQIETGQRIPSDRVAKNLALALGLPWQEVLRSVYVLRSREAGELFAGSGGSGEPEWRSVADIPAIRFLLFQLASLKLPPSDMETLVSNWSNDVQFLRTQLSRAHNG